MCKKWYESIICKECVKDFRLSNPNNVCYPVIPNCKTYGDGEFSRNVILVTDLKEMIENLVKLLAIS